MATQVKTLAGQTDPHPMNDFHDLRAPLVIGITGHRDIREEDRPQLLAAVKSILLELRNRYPSTPLVALSALAEGADRLAAQAALSPEIGARLFAALPMPQALYEQDFHGESLNEFRALLGRSDGVVELPLVNGNTLQEISHDGPRRDLQYESVGQYIVRKSQILIALWDGEKTGLVGGTSAVVDFQIEGLPQLEPHSFEALEGFPAYQVVTPRQKNPQPKRTAFERVDLYPKSFAGDEAKARGYYDHMFSRINDFNRYATNLLPELRGDMKKSKAYVLRDLDESQLSEELRTELDRYSLADTLAIKFQREKVQFDRRLHMFMFLAVVLFAFYAHIWPRPQLLGFALALVGFGIARRAAFRKRDGDTKFEDYRAMAEGLRVRFFWKLAGLPDSVTDNYLGKQRSELDWIRNGFRGWDIHSKDDKPSPGEMQKRINILRTNWVLDQKDYFHKAARRDEHRLERIEMIAKTSAYIAVGAGLLVFLYRSLSELRPGLLAPMNDLWHGVSIVFIESCLASAALSHNYGNRMAYREHIKQYARMEGVFSRATETLTTTNDQQQSLQCIRRLGREALAENGDWVLLHRERPLEMPHP